MVRASDPDGLATTAVVNIRVTDINDKNPEFLNLPYTFRTREGEADLFVGRVRVSGSVKSPPRRASGALVRLSGYDCLGD